MDPQTAHVLRELQLAQQQTQQMQVDYLRKLDDTLRRLANGPPYGSQLPDGFVPGAGNVPRGKQLNTRATAVGSTLWSGRPAIFEHSPLCPQAHSRPSGGECWKYGCKPYNGMRIAMQTPAEGFAGEFGALVRAEVGDPDYGGFIDSREFIIGPGAPVYLAVGQYPNVTVRIVDASATFPPLTMVWTQGDSSLVAAGGAAGLLRGAMISVDAPGNPWRTPNGALEVYTSAAVGIAWRITDDTAGAKPLVETLAAGQTTRVKAQNYSVNGPTNLQFYLAPL